MNIELRHLRSFLILATELNFTRAAAHLHLAQQALSAQIRQLEQELGFPLFERTTRSVRLTAAGRRLQRQLPAALSRLDAAIADVRLASIGAGSLTLGLLATAFLEFTPRLLRHFAAQWPNIAVTLRNAPFNDPTAGVRSGLCDIGLVWQPFTATGLATLPLFSEPRVALLAVDHPLASRRSLSAATLARQPFVWVEDLDPVARDYWTLAPQRDGAPATIGAHITGLEELFTAVRSGRAVASSPASLAQALPSPHLVTCPVRDLPPATVALCWRANDRNPVLAAFVEAARQLPTASAPSRRSSAAPRRAGSPPR